METIVKKYSIEYPLVSIVIPTHNRKEKLVRLIRSLLESNYPKDKLEIIIVDDASTDGTHEYISRLFPQVKVIRNVTERLLAESRNTGINLSHGEYIFIIDDDNIVDKDTIRELVKFMEKHPEVGIAGPIMFFLSDPKRIWCAGVKRNYWTTITRFIGFNITYNGRFRVPYESEDFPNAFMVRREVFKKIGLFNSRYFPIHYDEGDFCQRARRAGYKVMVVSTAKIWHDIPLPEQSRGSTLRLESPLRAYYVSRNRILFHWKWSKNMLQRIVALMISLAITLYYIIAVIGDRSIRGKYTIILSILKGINDVFKIIRRGDVRDFGRL